MAGDDETGDADPGAIVFSLHTKKPINIDEAPQPTAEYSFERCLHRGWVINRSKQTVRCQACGKDLDPYAVLHDIATEWDLMRNAQLEHRKLIEHNRRLREEEGRIKARTKNARRKDADEAVRIALGHAQQRNEFIAKWADEIGAKVDSIHRAVGLPRYRRRTQRCEHGTSPPEACKFCSRTRS